MALFWKKNLKKLSAKRPRENVSPGPDCRFRRPWSSVHYRRHTGGRRTNRQTDERYIIPQALPLARSTKNFSVIRRGSKIFDHPRIPWSQTEPGVGLHCPGLWPQPQWDGDISCWVCIGSVRSPGTPALHTTHTDIQGYAKLNWKFSFALFIQCTLHTSRKLMAV